MANLKGNQTTALKKFLTENFDTSFTVKRERIGKNVHYAVYLDKENLRDALTKIYYDGGFKVQVLVKEETGVSEMLKFQEFLSKRSIVCPQKFSEAQSLVYQIDCDERMEENRGFMNIISQIK